jgi:hypothetical protein
MEIRTVSGDHADNSCLHSALVEEGRQVEKKYGPRARISEGGSVGDGGTETRASSDMKCEGNRGCFDIDDDDDVAYTDNDDYDDDGDDFDDKDDDYIDFEAGPFKRARFEACPVSSRKHSGIHGGNMNGSKVIHAGVEKRLFDEQGGVDEMCKAEIDLLGLKTAPGSTYGVHRSICPIASCRKPLNTQGLADHFMTRDHPQLAGSQRQALIFLSRTAAKCRQRLRRVYAGRPELRRQSRARAQRLLGSESSSEGTVFFASAEGRNSVHSAYRQKVEKMFNCHSGSVDTLRKAEIKLLGLQVAPGSSYARHRSFCPVKLCGREISTRHLDRHVRCVHRDRASMPAAKIEALRLIVVTAGNCYQRVRKVEIRMIKDNAKAAKVDSTQNVLPISKQLNDKTGQCSAGRLDSEAEAITRKNSFRALEMDAQLLPRLRFTEFDFFSIRCPASSCGRKFLKSMIMEHVLSSPLCHGQIFACSAMCNALAALGRKAQAYERRMEDVAMRQVSLPVTSMAAGIALIAGSVDAGSIMFQTSSADVGAATSREYCSSVVASSTTTGEQPSTVTISSPEDPFPGYPATNEDLIAEDVVPITSCAMSEGKSLHPVDANNCTAVESESTNYVPNFSGSSFDFAVAGKAPISASAVSAVPRVGGIDADAPGLTKRQQVGFSAFGSATESMPKIAAIASCSPDPFRTPFTSKETLIDRSHISAGVMNTCDPIGKQPIASIASTCATPSDPERGVTASNFVDGSYDVGDKSASAVFQRQSQVDYPVIMSQGEASASLRGGDNDGDMVLCGDDLKNEYSNAAKLKLTSEAVLESAVAKVVTHQPTTLQQAPVEIILIDDDDDSDDIVEVSVSLACKSS